MGASYPINLNLQGRPCLVVGGGAVATRKVRTLSQAGAVLTVVAPRVSEEILMSARTGRLTWYSREFRGADAKDQQLVFAATSLPEVNGVVASRARAHGAWVNVADDPEGSDFHVPASTRRGELLVTVSTGGASPALAAWMRDRIATGLPRASENLVRLMRALRRVNREKAEPKRNGFQLLLNAGVLEDLERQDWEAVGAKVEQVFGADPAMQQIVEVIRREGR